MDLIFAPHVYSFTKGTSGLRWSPKVTLQPLSGPKVAWPTCHTPKKCGGLKQGDQGTQG